MHRGSAGGGMGCEGLFTEPRPAGADAAKGELVKPLVEQVIGSGPGSGSLPDSGRGGEESSDRSGVEGLPRIDTSSAPARKGSGTRAGGASPPLRVKPAASSKAPPAAPAEEPSRPKPKTAWTDIHFQGLPILFWILFLVGIGAAVALAIAFVRSRG